MANREPKPAKCFCGEVFAGIFQLAYHKEICEVLEDAVIEEIRRIDREVHSPPRIKDYIKHRNKELPPATWVITRYGDWLDILDDAGIDIGDRAKYRPGRRRKEGESAVTFAPVCDLAEGLTPSSMYDSYSCEEMASALDRTQKSIRTKCWRLGLNTKQPKLTIAERERIREWYTQRANAERESFDLQSLSDELGRTKHVISRCAGEMGLTRNARPVGDSMRTGISKKVKSIHESNGHPRGMLGKRHTEEFKSKQSERVKSRAYTDEQISARVDKMMQTKIEKYGTGRANWAESSNPYSRAKRGRREDLGDVFFRSAWEANYARYLNWLIDQGEIARWEYEPQVFTFHGETRGVISYTPDFKVFLADGSHEWHEVKGWETSKDRTKIKRMRKHYPDEKVIMIDAKVYKGIAKWKSLIPNWEGR